MSCNCNKETENQYKYIFQYIDGNTKVTYEIPADTDIWKLSENLRNFLCAASWDEDTLAKVLDWDGDE